MLNPNKKFDKLEDKLIYYVKFLDSFIKRGDSILRENDWHQLKMLREYIIDAIKKIKNIS